MRKVPTPLVAALKSTPHPSDTFPSPPTRERAVFLIEIGGKKISPSTSQITIIDSHSMAMAVRFLILIPRASGVDFDPESFRGQVELDNDE